MRSVSRSRQLAVAVLGALLVVCMMAAAAAFAAAPSSSSTVVLEGGASEPGDAPTPIAVEVAEPSSWWANNGELLLFLGFAVVLIGVIWFVAAGPARRRALGKRMDETDTQRREGS